MKAVMSMDRLFLTILNMSLTGAFAIAAICLLRLPLKRVPKIISYCLWAVAGFRLVFPFSFESVLGLIPFRAQTIPTDLATQSVPRIDSGIAALDNFVNSTLPTVTAPPMPTDFYSFAAANSSVSWVTIGAYLWLLGALAMLIYGVVSYLILKRKMRDAIHIGENIFEAENIKSPFLLGIIRPKIYLPIGLSAEEYEYILLHEQTHIRRRDHVIKFAAYFILALHWFNPLAWVAFLLMSADMEMSCDERVLKEMGMDEKSAYSRSLVSFTAKRRFVASSPLAFGEGGMKERVKNVLNLKKHSRIIVAIAVVLTVTLSIGLAMNRAATETRYPNEAIEYSEPNNYELMSTETSNDDIEDVITDDDDSEFVHPNFQHDSQQIHPSTHNTSLHGTGSAEQEIFGMIGMFGRDSMLGTGWDFRGVSRNSLSPITNAQHLNNFAASIAVMQGGVWSEDEETALLRQTQRIFERFSELREISYFIGELEIDDDRIARRNDQLTATRDAINGVEQWCMEIRETEILPDSAHYFAHGAIVFLWMPEGHDNASVLAFVESLPIPDPDWRFDGISISNYFIEYGEHVYSILISYTVPGDFWLTDAADDIMTQNATQLFEQFSDLMFVTFAIETIQRDWEFHSELWIHIHRNDIIS
jgi:beta-lactamase regulating signal transducer with metallopeptidase domain